MDESRIISQQSIEDFLESMKSENLNPYKMSECRKNVQTLMEKAASNNYKIDKSILHKWRNSLADKGYAKGTVTNRMVYINNYLRFMGWDDLCFCRGGKMNLSGKTFGSLSVLYPTGKRSRDRSVIWMCRCEACGKEKEIPANQLKYGVPQSCGCHKKEILSEANKYIDDTCLRMVMSDKLWKNNTSGYKGVCNKNGHWQARIQYKKKVYYLGTYKKIEDAVRARKQAEDIVRKDALKLENIYNEKFKEEPLCMNICK